MRGDRAAAAGRAAATAAAAVLGPAIATYTAALLCDTAVPAWHDGHREMPYLFAGSAAAAAGGLGMLALPPDRAGLAARLALLGAAAELTAKPLLVRRLGTVAEPYQRARPGALMRAAEVLTACGLGTAGWPGPGAAGRCRCWPGPPCDGLGAHPVRRLRGRPGVGPRPEIHRRTAARTRHPAGPGRSAGGLSPAPPGRAWPVLVSAIRVRAAGRHAETTGTGGGRRAAGTTALNAVTYLDMVLRARPSSGTPERIVTELANRSGHPIPGTGEEVRHRVQGLGALSGLGTGVLLGAVAGVLRPVVLRLGPVLGSAALGGPAMLASDLPLTRLGIADPASWDAVSWASDAVPHLAYGAVTYGALATWK